MSETCPRQGRTFGGCRFEARYDEEPMLYDFKTTDITLGAFRAFIDGSRKRTSVRDVCIRCGRTIERQKP